MLLRKLIVNGGAAIFVILGLQYVPPLTASEAILVGLASAFVGTLVMEYG